MLSLVALPVVIPNKTSRALYFAQYSCRFLVDAAERGGVNIKQGTTTQVIDMSNDKPSVTFTDGVRVDYDLLNRCG